MIKVAVVEDLPIILEGFKVLINQIDDFEIVGEFLNGKQFIDHLDNLDADIILTDIDMPVMDGITATRMAVSINPDIKIIALSMYTDRKYYYEMVTAGAKGFVLKQAQFKELETAIREVYSGGHFFSQDLLRGVIMNMQGIEEVIVKEKKDLFKLSERENELLQLLCQGLSNKELADKMFLSVRSIESIKTKLMQKTNTKNNAGLIIWAIKNQIVSI